jgi:thiol:disulfide interchange protein
VSLSGSTPPPADRAYAYWILRVLESGLLVVGLVGIAMFAYSIVDILRMGTAEAPGTSFPVTAWPGVILFLASMVLLQLVRAVLHRYRRDDGTPRTDARGRAAKATAEILAALPDDPQDVAAPAEAQGEG